MVRAVTKGVPVVSLTATASSEIREAIITDLSMTNCDFVIEDSNRCNIKYSVFTVDKDFAKTFSWLLKELKNKGQNSHRVLIFG